MSTENQSKPTLDRHITNFPSYLKTAITEYRMQDDKMEKFLFYYQQWMIFAFENNLSKGIMLNHHMGAGKTITAIAIADVALSGKVRINGNPIDSVYFMGPPSLKKNFFDSIQKYNELTGRNVDPAKFTFLKKSYTATKNISRNERKDEFNALSGKNLKNITNVKILENRLIIIDEAHQVNQLISNGSEGFIEFYDLLMRSPNIRIVMLTGTIINSKPFELVPMLNLLSGETLFPENHKVFMEMFWNSETKQMINKNKFQNRIFGLVSRIDPNVLDLDISTGKMKNNVSNYPELYEEIVRQVPMSMRQFSIYRSRREEEVKEKDQEFASKGASGRFSKGDKAATTYRVRTRQCSNFAPPADIEIVLGKQGFTVEDYDAILAKATPVEKESPKFWECDKIIKQHKNQKGIIYSQFVGIGGNGALAYFLETHGYKRFVYEEYKKGDKLVPHKTFAMLNGQVDEKEYSAILDIFNSDDNFHGETIFLLLIGTREALGLDLKCVRFGIMLEPFWTWSLYLQFIHRMKRYLSHVKLPAAERNCQPYILLAVYPENVNDEIRKLPGFATTTDEAIYKIMVDNKLLTTPFADAVFEVSIECLILQDLFKEMKCRICAPNNARLYTAPSKINNDPEKLLHYDILEPDPCQELQTETIKAEKIEITGEDGIKMEFYYVADKSAVSGFRIYKFVPEKDLYEELFSGLPIFKIILNKIKSKK